MQVKSGENKPLILTAGTYDGIYIHANLFASAVNTALVQADFNPRYVQIQVQLQRNGQTIMMMNDNLLLHGMHNCRRNGLWYFLNGIDYTLAPAGSGNYANKVRSAKLRFGSPLTLTGNDQCLIQLNFNSQALSANVNSATSYIDFYGSTHNGIEIGVGCTSFDVVQANISNQQFAFNPHTIFSQFLNFDQNDFTNPVIASFGLNSSNWQRQVIAYEAYAEEQFHYVNRPPFRYSANVAGLPSANPPTPVEGLDFYPQSLVLFGELPDVTLGHRLPPTIENGNCNIIFNSVNVNASQNYVGKTSLFLSPDALAKYAKRVAAHASNAILSAGTSSGN